MSFTQLDLKEVQLNETEKKVQKYIKSFCNFLPLFINNLKKIKEEVNTPLQNLCNLSEQLRHIEKVKIKNLKTFNEMQQKLDFKVTSCIEEELFKIKKVLDKLHIMFNELKNKLFSMEQSTLELNWEEKSDLIDGTASQPKLTFLLDLSLEFWNSINFIYKGICGSFKNLNVRDEKSVNCLNDSFKFSVDSKKIQFLVAITNYIEQ